MILLLAAGVQVPWPFAILGSFLVVIAALGSAIAVLRANSVQTNLKLLRDERDDYKEAKRHADEMRDEAEAKEAEAREELRKQIEQCDRERKEFTAKLDTLSSVVSGGHAVRESTDLILTAQTVAHKEVLSDIAHTRADLKMVMEALIRALSDRPQEGAK